MSIVMRKYKAWALLTVKYDCPRYICMDRCVANAMARRYFEERSDRPKFKVVEIEFEAPFEESKLRPWTGKKRKKQEKP